MFFLTDNYWKWLAPPCDTNPGCAPDSGHLKWNDDDARLRVEQWLKAMNDEIDDGLKDDGNEMND